MTIRKYTPVGSMAYAMADYAKYERAARAAEREIRRGFARFTSNVTMMDREGNAFTMVVKAKSAPETDWSMVARLTGHASADAAMVAHATMAAAVKQSTTRVATGETSTAVTLPKF